MCTLAQLFCGISDQAQMDEVLLAVLTDKEREAISNRLAIIQMLSDKKTQRGISAELGVGIATVTRGAHALREGKFDVLQSFLCQPSPSIATLKE